MTMLNEPMDTFEDPPEVCSTHACSEMGGGGAFSHALLTGVFCAADGLGSEPVCFRR